MREQRASFCYCKNNFLYYNVGAKGWIMWKGINAWLNRHARTANAVAFFFSLASLARDAQAHTLMTIDNKPWTAMSIVIVISCILFEVDRAYFSKRS